MEEEDSLARLQGLQADLVAFSESRLPNLERLWAELEGSIADFRNLLDRKQKSDKSRQALSSNTITVDDSEYEINEEFRQDVIQTADELNLDELEAAKLYLQSRETAEELDRPPTLASIFRFHGRREALLQCLRLSIQQAVDVDLEPEHRDVFIELFRIVARGEQANLAAGSDFWRRCVTAMADIEQWLETLNNRLMGAAIIGQTNMGYALEALQFERDSLLKQHEALGAVVCLLVKDGHTTVDDYRFLISKTAALERLNDVVLHYIPVLVSCASCYGPVESSSTLRDARSLDLTFSDTTEKSRWKLPDFRAAASTWWLAEYSGRYIDNPMGSPLRGVDLEAENEARSKRFMDAIRDGAFEFMLHICSQLRPDQWLAPAKANLVTYLLSGSDRLRNGPLNASDFFQELLAQNLQLFVEAFISHMPDTIRRLKYEEDEQRRNLTIRQNHGPPDYSLHLERFMLIISYAFQGFPEAAHSFWSDPDGNLYGFLQWASKRQSTPRAAAFCEMFRCIAEDDECAEAAHRFLMDDVSSTSARLRRGAPLSWTQILAELSFYTPAANEGKLTATSLLQPDNALSGPIVEPESELMLECYLRLTSHMCRTSESARTFILGNPSLRLQDTVLDLISTGVSPRLRACAYTVVAALLANKRTQTGHDMWETLDAWVFDVPAQKTNIGKSANPQSNTSSPSAARLEYISEGFDQPNAFIHLLQALLCPSSEQSGLDDALPFPEQLGLAYRMPGIEPYVDFTLGLVFRNRTVDLPDISQIWELRCTCLDFIAMCLSTFNEDLVIFANNTNLSVDSAISTSSLAAYVRLHPFARVMEWMFNDGVIAALFAAAHEDVDVINSCSPGSPPVVALCRSIQIMSMILRLQSTYFDIVRPVVKMQSQAREKTIANPAFASFEDAVLNHVNIVTDLGLYCGTGHRELTLLSIELLQNLATSRKLSVASGIAHSGSRVLAALQQDSDNDRIAAAFIAPLHLDARELELGDTVPGLAIKQGILDLVNSSLDVSPHRPALAHCLLGFQCGDRVVNVVSNSLFAKGASLFHAVAKLSADTSCLEQTSSRLWLSSIRRASCQILHKLLRSPLTERLVIDELRESGYADAVAVVQHSISADSLWCGRTCADPEFLISDSAPVFRNFLTERAAFFERASIEIRSSVQRSSPTLRQKIISSLLGLTTLASLEEVQNVSVFEMFDFIDLPIALPFRLNEQRFFGNLDFNICKSGVASRGAVYDTKLVKELLLLREAELRKNAQLADQAVQQQATEEMNMVVLSLQSENEYSAIASGQRAALNAWVQLVSLVLALGEFEPAPKTALVLQALQIILPKFDKTLGEDTSLSLPLAKLVYTLVRVADSGAVAGAKEGSATNDRLVHTFRSSLRGVASATSTTDLRETCYQIIRHYIESLWSSQGTQSAAQRQCIKIVEYGGERLIDTICEDALSSQGTCRISALLVIEACVQLFQTAKSSYMIRALTRLNFTSVLVDGIREIAAQFQNQHDGHDLPAILSYFHTGLAVLLRMSQTNEGATAILEAGLFSSIRDSQLFAADPDIGLDVENAEALENFYRLLVAMLRIVISTVVTKGSRNQHVIAQGSQFLRENRQCMQGIFKAATRSEKLPTSGREALDELVDLFTFLIHVTGFLESDEKPIGPRKPGNLFT